MRNINHICASRKTGIQDLFRAAARWACRKFGWRTSFEELAAAALKKWRKTRGKWLPIWLPKYVQANPA